MAERLEARNGSIGSEFRWRLCNAGINPLTSPLICHKASQQQRPGILGDKWLRR